MARHDSIGRAIVLGAVLAVGIAAVWAAAIGWSVIIVQQFTYEPPLRQSVVISKDGTPLIRSYTSYRDPWFETLDGEPVTPDQNRLLGGVFLRSARRTDTFFFRQSWGQRIYPLSDGAKPERFWYFVHDGRREGAGYFEGFDRKSKGRIGFIGMNGYAQERPPQSEWFPVDGRDFPYGNALVTSQYQLGAEEPYEHSFSPDSWPDWTVFLHCQSKLLEVDLRRRTARTILEDPHLSDIASKAIPAEALDGEPHPDRKFRFTVAARLKDRIAFLDKGGKELASRQIPEPLLIVPFRAYFVPENRMLFTASKRCPETGEEDVTVYWTDGKGSILNERKVTLVASGPRDDVGQVGWLISGILPIPAVFTPIMVGISPLAEMELRAGSYREGLERALLKIWPMLLVVNVVGVLLAILAVRRQRKFGLGHRKTWAVFVFLFGVPGYLAYLCHRRWPVREECPACHVPAPRDRAACAFCDTPFPPPEPKGIEIFA